MRTVDGFFANPPSGRTAPGEVSEPPAAGRAQISQQRRRKRRRKCWQGQSLRLSETVGSCPAPLKRLEGPIAR